MSLAAKRLNLNIIASYLFQKRLGLPQKRVAGHLSGTCTNTAAEGFRARNTELAR
jgi:hypothetical protein